MRYPCVRLCVATWIVVVCVPWLAYSQVPVGAQVHAQEVVQFAGTEQPVRVIFYELRGEFVGVVLVNSKGQEISHVKKDLRLGLDKATGVYDATGDGQPEIIVVGVGGAKTLSATVYAFRNHSLYELGNWSGWGFEVIRLDNEPVIVHTPRQYGSLPDLYVWRNNRFVQANQEFPELFVNQIEEQKRILRSPKGLPPYVIAQACQLGAQALVYGRKYKQGEALCEKALSVLQELSAEKEQLANAQREIRRTLDRIRVAQSKSLGQLPPNF